MTMKEVEIKISKDGKSVDLDALNFEGSGCSEIRDKLVSAIGAVDDEGKKPEFFNQGGTGVSIGS